MAILKAKAANGSLSSAFLVASSLVFGLIPTTGFAEHLLKLNQTGQIPVNPKTQRTEVEGIWAAGDSTDGLYHQNNIAAGDAVKALEDIYLFLHAGK